MIDWYMISQPKHSFESGLNINEERDISLLEGTTI